LLHRSRDEVLKNQWRALLKLDCPIESKFKFWAFENRRTNRRCNKKIQVPFPGPQNLKLKGIIFEKFLLIESIPKVCLQHPNVREDIKYILGSAAWVMWEYEVNNGLQGLGECWVAQGGRPGEFKVFKGRLTIIANKVLTSKESVCLDERACENPAMTFPIKKRINAELLIG